MAILFISHRFKEVFDFAKRITVLKDGQMVGTVMADEVTPDDVIKMMVGRQLDHYFPDLAKRRKNWVTSSCGSRMLPIDRSRISIWKFAPGKLSAFPDWKDRGERHWHTLYLAWNRLIRTPWRLMGRSG